MPPCNGKRHRPTTGKLTLTLGRPNKMWLKGFLLEKVSPETPESDLSLRCTRTLVFEGSFNFKIFKMCCTLLTWILFQCCTHSGCTLLSWIVFQCCTHSGCTLLSWILFQCCTLLSWTKFLRCDNDLSVITVVPHSGEEYNIVYVQHRTK